MTKQRKEQFQLWSWLVILLALTIIMVASGCGYYSKEVLVPGPQGLQGEPGKDGEQGPQGDPGEPCSVTRVSNGVLLECADSSEIIMDGVDGISPVIDVIDPCGEGVGFNELLVLLETAQGRMLIAFFEDGNGHRFLTEITPGSYRTTDSQGCVFQVTEDLEVIDG